MKSREMGGDDQSHLYSGMDVKEQERLHEVRAQRFTKLASVLIAKFQANESGLERAKSELEHNEDNEQLMDLVGLILSGQIRSIADRDLDTMAKINNFLEYLINHFED